MRAMEKSIFTPEYAILREELVRVRTDAGLTQRALALRPRVREAVHDDGGLRLVGADVAELARPGTVLRARV